MSTVALYTEAFTEPMVVLYTTYLLISVMLTVWVARTLYKNGRIFLVDTFLGNETLADSVNHLLVVGFYLINIGYVALALKSAEIVMTLQGLIEVLSGKVGLVLIILGFMHFFNMLIFSVTRKIALASRRENENLPPVQPDGGLAVSL